MKSSHSRPILYKFPESRGKRDFFYRELSARRQALQQLNLKRNLANMPQSRRRTGATQDAPKRSGCCETRSLHCKTEENHARRGAGCWFLVAVSILIILFNSMLMVRLVQHGNLPINCLSNNFPPLPDFNTFAPLQQRAPCDSWTLENCPLRPSYLPAQRGGELISEHY